MEGPQLNDDQRSRIQAILNYWYIPGSDRNGDIDPSLFKKWFGASAETDAEITQNFKEDLLKLANGDHEAWKHDKEGKLAAVILCDQFTRNIFRKNKQAFDYDHIAMEIVKSISDEEFSTYALQEQGFLILPYEHDERLESQVKSTELADLMMKNALAIPDVAQGILRYAEQLKKYTEQHKATIDQFGRYPHRNEVLERESTPEEVEYLKTAERYGQ
ncbi:membrane protein [Stylonychia lemnae]|uniref:Membrane protein n=1 Tax=Stylonychia lemnae TaxID=5949 RepID=A0A078AXH8_STYLE|nr:membrane protein [Stylonychia lemnae]|eukprot:CDW86869.1 membrane protein [Stylonychia lemnae]